ncbi:placenta-specific gene 8 protein-like [Mercenaria mercenaria]|uniref:placenta-specific gene 8 protein-like n=1 Tax=Mercenaria mercenaria TaxID=6596 RepID=UPI00234EC121|nr:placenta-specific gene 8 protein-like [Mercenaria mercenaria]
MSKTSLPPAEVYAPHPPDYQSHTYPSHGYQPPSHHHPPAQHTTFAPVTHQPVSQSTNVQLTMAGAVATNPTRFRPWTTDLCGCMQDIETCMMAWCCTPCFLAKLSKEMDECVCTSCCVPGALMAMRVKVRAANRIKGSICEDCIITSCCPLLTMCQMKRELDNVALKKPGTQL